MCLVRDARAVTPPRTLLSASEHICVVLYAYPKMTKRLRSNSTWATIAPVPGSKAGVMEVRITGPFTRRAFDDLRPQVLRVTMKSPATVVRLDTSTDLVFSPPDIGADVYPPGLPPQAVIVSEASYDLWTAHTQVLARVGVTRSVFLPSQAHYAYEWAEMYAALRSERPARDFSPTGPTPLA